MATLKIDRGTSYARTGTVRVDGELVTLVGATIRFTVKPEEFDNNTSDLTAIVTKNVTNGTAEGAYTIALDPADTATVEPGDYFYDVKVKFPTGAVYKIDEGKIKLDGSPTNRLS